jgi:hypothetical protein
MMVRFLNPPRNGRSGLQGSSGPPGPVECPRREGNRPRSGRWRAPTVVAARPTWAPTTMLRMVPRPVPGRILAEANHA